MFAHTIDRHVIHAFDRAALPGIPANPSKKCAPTPWSDVQIMYLVDFLDEHPVVIMPEHIMHVKNMVLQGTYSSVPEELAATFDMA